MKLILLMMVITSSIFAMSAKPKVYQDYHIIGFDMTKEALTLKDITTALEKVGITILDDQDMNAQFLKSHQKSAFKSYHVLSYFHKSISPALIKNNPYAGLFYPAGMAIYQKKDDPYLWISFLSSRTHSKILTLKKREMLLADLDKSILSALLSISSRVRFQQVGSSLDRERKTLNLFTLNVTQKVNLAQQLKNLRSKLEKGFQTLAYRVVGAIDVNEDLKKSQGGSDYDFYFTYALSKTNLLYVTSKRYPEVGAFTPTTFIVYKRKDAQEIVMVYPDVSNAIDSSNITQTESLRILSKTQGEIDNFMSALTK